METKIKVAKPLKGFRSVVWPAVGRQSLMALPMSRGICTWARAATNDISEGQRPNPLVGLDHRPRSSQPGLARVGVYRRPGR